MEENTLKLIIESLKDQKEIFGDELFKNINFDNLNLQKNHQTIEKSTLQKNEISVHTTINLNEFADINSLDELYNKICNCTKCALSETRNKFVFGSGNSNADVMVIGEAPGADEDKQGLPFVGRAGRLLTDILKAIKFEREEVYIANILKCRPPNNRNPLPDEMNTCMPHLQKQIQLIKPKVILCLGLVAAKALLNSKLSLTKMRGNIYEINNIPAMVTYHPAALLRNPNWKRGCWEDVQKFRKLYDELKN